MIGNNASLSSCISTEYVFSFRLLLTKTEREILMEKKVIVWKENALRVYPERSRHYAPRKRASAWRQLDSVVMAVQPVKDARIV